MSDDPKEILRPLSKVALSKAKVDNRLDDIQMDIIEKIYELAMRSGGQQVGALQTLMKVLITPKKPQSALVDLNLVPGLSLTDKAEAILEAGISGRLAPDAAAVLGQTMISLCQIKSSDELTDRIAKLEELLSRLGNE